MKKLSVRVGEYEKDGQTRGRYVNVGVIIQKPDGKEFVLLDPHISLAGLMTLQNAEAMKKNEPLHDRVLAGVFEEDQQQQPQQPSYQQPQQPQQPQQAPQQGYQQQPQGYGNHRG